jgi:hypothetical protein
MKPDVTVVIPTVTSREHYLARCIASYEANTTGSVEILVYKDLPGIAFGWQRGAEDACGRYVHMTNDDCEALPGWDVPAIKMVQQGSQPAPRLFNADGRPWTKYPDHGSPARISSCPFLAREWWPDVTPLPPGMHYYTDNWITMRLAQAGVGTLLCHGYDLIHTWAQEHRGAGWTEPERMTVDKEYAHLAASIIARGAEALKL